MVELAKRGVFPVLVCSKPFEQLARMQAARLGQPDLPLIVIEHPLGGLALDKVRERAEALAASFIGLLKPAGR
jgi:hypothetical protein